MTTWRGVDDVIFLILLRKISVAIFILLSSTAVTFQNINEQALILNVA